VPVTSVFLDTAPAAEVRQQFHGRDGLAFTEARI
jgi:hypothetical protein